MRLGWKVIEEKNTQERLPIKLSFLSMEQRLQL